MSASDRDALQNQVVDYLLDRIDQGQVYLKSRHIASELGLSAKRVGQLLARIDRDDPRVDLERRGGNSDGTTWRASRGDAVEP